MNNLEKIADALLEGKINPKEAELLSKNIKDYTNHSKKIKYETYIENIGNTLEIKDEDKSTLGYLVYSFESNIFDTPYMILQDTKCFEKGKGHFRKMFNQLCEIAQRNKAEYIDLEVDKENKNARDIYEYMGFHYLPADGFDNIENMEKMRYFV